MKAYPWEVKIHVGAHNHKQLCAQLTAALMHIKACNGNPAHLAIGGATGAGENMGDTSEFEIFDFHEPVSAEITRLEMRIAELKSQPNIRINR